MTSDTPRGDAAYCRMIALARTTPCLGWEAKAKSGAFGTAEFDAHKRCHEEYGKHLAYTECEQEIATLKVALAAANAKLAAKPDVAGLVARKVPESLTYAHMTDKQMADKVRMLLRSDLDFEPVCSGGRDRIRFLSEHCDKQAAALLSLSAQLAEKEEHLSQTLDQLQRHMNWDSAEWDRQLLALKRQLTEKEAECEMKLPCGVKLDSGTHIGKGCALSTLIVALKARAKYKADAARQP